MVSVASKGRGDRLHDEFDYERKVRKRKAKLVSAAEEAFTHIRRMGENQLGKIIQQTKFQSINLFHFHSQ